jgi:hypothetical protein
MHGNFMTADEVIRRLKENLQSGNNFFAKDVAADKKAVQGIFKQYRFTAFEKEFIAFVKEANFLRTHILDMYHWLSQSFMAIFDKIGRPFGYKGFDFRNMTPDEIIAWYQQEGDFKLRKDNEWLWYRFGDERKVVDTPRKIAKALKILKDHKHLELFINSFELCSIPDVVSLSDKKLLRFQLLTNVDPHEELRIDYVVPSDDIEGHTDKVNKYVGNLSGLDKDLQEDLRLAWLIYNGYKYAISKNVKLNSDFLPRVVNYYRRVML